MEETEKFKKISFYQYIHRIKNFGDYLQSKYISPRNKNEDIARREYIFNVLLIGFLSLTLLAFVLTLARLVYQGSTNENLSPYFLVPPLSILLLLYIYSRKNFQNALTYIFVAVYLLLGSYSLYKYSVALPQGLLIYTLVIVVSGILISSRAALLVTTIAVISIIMLAYAQAHSITHPYTAELNDSPKRNAIVNAVIFAIIFLVSWLSNREITKSLNRARESEKLLERERNLLETRVKKRTKELEKAQVEKSLELYRFAEFGRLSSSIVHDLANPLTAVSINLDELSNKQDTYLTRQMKEGLGYLEQYLQSARHQLSGQGQNKAFDSSTEIEKVISFLSTKAQDNRVRLSYSLKQNAKLYGDISKFHQVIANLIANGIDSYSNTKRSKVHLVHVKSTKNERYLTISVTDNGMGISLEDLPKIYEPFYSTKSSERGTGIGLTITKDIIEKDFHGKISVESTAKKGTSFSVDLPLRV